MRTNEERRRERLELIIGVLVLVGAVLIGAVLILARTTDVFEVPPTPTEVVEPTATENIAAQPLPMEVRVFTSPVSYGETFYVELYTEPGTRCQLSARVFSLAVGNYQTIPMADYTTDGSGICGASLPIDASMADGEQELRIQLQNGPRIRQGHWPFVIAP